MLVFLKINVLSKLTIKRAIDKQTEGRLMKEKKRMKVRENQIF